MGKETITVVTPPPGGTLVQVVDKTGARVPLGLSFGWSTRTSTDAEIKAGFCPEAFGAIAVGPNDSSQKLGKMLKDMSPPSASSSGSGGSVHIMTVDSTGILQRVMPFNYALVPTCTTPDDGTTIPLANEIWVSDTPFDQSPDNNVQAAIKKRKTDCSCKNCS